MTKIKTMTFQDTMITLAGYQSETHKVVTPDGYILTLYRLADDDMILMMRMIRTQ